MSEPITIDANTLFNKRGCPRCGVINPQPGTLLEVDPKGQGWVSCWSCQQKMIVEFVKPSTIPPDQAHVDEVTKGWPTRQRKTPESPTPLLQEKGLPQPGTPYFDRPVILKADGSISTPEMEMALIDAAVRVACHMGQGVPLVVAAREFLTRKFNADKPIELNEEDLKKVVALMAPPGFDEELKKQVDSMGGLG